MLRVSIGQSPLQDAKTAAMLNEIPAEGRRLTGLARTQCLSPSDVNDRSRLIVEDYVAGIRVLVD